MGPGLLGGYCVEVVPCMVVSGEKSYFSCCSVRGLLLCVDSTDISPSLIVLREWRIVLVMLLISILPFVCSSPACRNRYPSRRSYATYLGTPTQSTHRLLPPPSNSPPKKNSCPPPPLNLSIVKSYPFTPLTRPVPTKGPVVLLWNSVIPRVMRANPSGIAHFF